MLNKFNYSVPWLQLAERASRGALITLQIAEKKKRINYYEAEAEEASPELAPGYENLLNILYRELNELEAQSLDLTFKIL